MLFGLDVELVIKLEPESSSSRCGVSPLPTLSGSERVKQHGVLAITEPLLFEEFNLFKARFSTVNSF